MVDEALHGHSPEEIRQRLQGSNGSQLLKDAIYGGVDGAITTFAIVAGVQGASLSSVVVLILGLSNLLADGFSMASSNYAGSKAEAENLERLRAIENAHIRDFPEGETEEIRQILRSKGVSEAQLEATVLAVTDNRELWIDMMLIGEYGVSPVDGNPLASAITTFIAFLVCGAVPLLPYILPVSEPFLWSSVSTLIVFFLIGALKSRWSIQSWWRSGGGTLIIGAVAAVIAYAVGAALSGLVPTAE